MRLRLSQSQLTLLDQCPRKFQHVYLDQLGIPTPADEQAHLIWGSRFHLLMQQREWGLVYPAILPEEQPLQRCVDRFVQTVPDLFAPTDDRLRQSEHRRSFMVQDYGITVVYDLLVLAPEAAEIHDWKTYAQPPPRDRLQSHWQTRLYLYGLAETSDYDPSQIAMTYWFVAPTAQVSRPPERLRFSYSDRQHQNTHGTLHRLLHQLTQWLDRYEAGEALPQVAESVGDCAQCPFAVRCQRDQSLSQPAVDLMDWAEIPEVTL